MAIANLKQELEDIINAIRRPKGGDSGDDPLRRLFDKIPASFELELDQMVRELRLVQQRAPETGKYGGALYSEFVQQGDDKKLVEFAKAWIQQFKKEVQKKSTALEVRFDIDQPTHLLVTAIFKPGTTESNVFNFFSTRQKETRQALTSTGKYDDVLTRASKSQKGTEVFNIGHHVSVAEARLSVFTSMAVRSAADSGAFDHLEDKGKKLIVQTVKTSLSNLNLNIEITDNIDIYIGKDGALEGTMQIKYDAESWFKNQVLRQEEAQFGAALTNPKDQNSIINLLNEMLVKQASERLKGESASAFAKRKGSRTLEENALAILVNNPTMRKAYAKGLAKNLTSITYKPKKRNNKTSSALKYEGKRTSYKVKGGNKILPPKPKKTQQGVESGQNNLTQKAFEVRAFVNSRLTGKVKSNMGRPRLINQSGRFAESVQVVNSNALGNQIHLDYTYNPIYRVFENGGYSSNYDPRPLIEKSIRELAIQKAEAKFTLRRI